MTSTTQPTSSAAATLEAVMQQAEIDLAAAHAEICKLQGLDPATHSWPEWSSPANTLRWFKAIRAGLNAKNEALAVLAQDTDVTRSCGCVFRDLNVPCRNVTCKICHTAQDTDGVAAELVEALEYAREKMWTYGFSENDLKPIRDAITKAVGS